MVIKKPEIKKEVKLATNINNKKVLIKYGKLTKQIITYEVIRNALIIQPAWYRKIINDQQMRVLSKNHIHKTKLKKRAIDNLEEHNVDKFNRMKQAGKLDIFKEVADFNERSVNNNSSKFSNHLKQEKSRINSIIKLDEILDNKREKKKKLIKEVKKLREQTNRPIESSEEEMQFSKPNKIKEIEDSDEEEMQFSTPLKLKKKHKNKSSSEEEMQFSKPRKVKKKKKKHKKMDSSEEEMQFSKPRKLKKKYRDNSSSEEEMQFSKPRKVKNKKKKKHKKMDSSEEEMQFSEPSMKRCRKCDKVVQSKNYQRHLRSVAHARNSK